MAEYYVNKSGSGSGDGSISDPWKEFAEITGLEAGNTVYLNRGDTWTAYLPIDVNNIIVDAYGSGDKPLIDLSGVVGDPGYPNNVAIYPNSIALSDIKNIRAKGSGYAEAVGAYSSGGDDYGVVCTNVDILENINTASPVNASDGFAVNSTSQLDLINCTVAKCRIGDWETGYLYLVGNQCYYDSGTGNVLYKCTEEHTSGAEFDSEKFTTVGIDESNQVLTGHTGVNKIRATNCTFENSCSLIRFGAVTSASVIMSNCTVNDITLDVFGPTANVDIITNDCTISNTDWHSHLIAAGSAGSLMMNSCGVTIGSNVDSGEAVVTTIIVMDNTDITCNGSARYAVNAGGSLSVTGGTWDINSSYYKFLVSRVAKADCVLNGVVLKGSDDGVIGADTAGGFILNDCPVIIDGAVDQILEFNSTGEYDIDHCTVYQAAGGSGEFINRLASTPTVNLTNCIFEDVVNVDHGASGTLNVSYNCYHNSEDLGGAGSITDDPLFKDAANGDFRLTVDSPCRGAASDGSDMGALQYTVTTVGDPFSRTRGGNGAFGRTRKRL